MPLSPGWTGAQYSLFRSLFGLYLFVHFAQLLPWGTEVFSDQGVLADPGTTPLVRLFPNVLALWDGPSVVGLLLALGALAGVALALGWHDRIAALVAWYVLACLFGRNPLTANPALPFVGWMLLAHALLPQAPFGSLRARGRVDPGGSWYLPQPLFVAAWVVMSVAYAYSGATKLVSPSWVDGSALARVLENPLARPGPLREMLLALPPVLLRLATWGALALELLFPLFAAVRRLRPWGWLAMVGLHLGLLATIDFADLTLGMLLLHAFTFDPAWIRPMIAGASETVFYDGSCGVCHGFVRFVLAEDRPGNRFDFAPLGGQRFAELVPETARADLPDTVVVRTASGDLLVRSAAVRHVLAGLGGVWRVLAVASGAIPKRLLDAAYDGMARVRRSLAPVPNGACPLLPPHLRARFDV